MDEPEIPTTEIASETSPLRAVVTEIHEIYEELKYVGFPDQAANDIVAHLIVSVINSRNDDTGFASVTIEDSDEDDYDEDDIDDDYNGAG